MTEKLQIDKLRGDDGYKVFSIRAENEIVEQLDEIARKTNRSRNDVINIMLKFGIKNCEIKE